MHPSKYWPSAKLLDLGDRLVPDTPNAIGSYEKVFLLILFLSLGYPFYSMKKTITIWNTYYIALFRYTMYIEEVSALTSTAVNNDANDLKIHSADNIVIVSQKWKVLLHYAIDT